MKSFIFASLVCFFALTFASAQEVSRTFNVSGFTKLDLGSAFKIDVKQGSNYQVIVTGKANDLDDLEYGVTRSTLRIGYKNNGWRKSRENVRVSITMPSLDGVDFSGASTASVRGFEGGSMSVAVSGASRVEMNFSAKNVELDLSGASRVMFIGQATSLEGEISGASEFNGKQFPAQKVNLNASGASSASVIANSSLQVDASGASRISYAGKVRDVRSSTSGAGSVRRAN